MLSFYTSYIVPASVFIPIFFGLKYYRSLTLPFKTILWFTIFSGLVNYLNIYVLMQYFKLNSIMLVNLYTVFEFLFISLFYLSLQNKTGRAVITVVMGTFVAFCIANVLFIQKSNNYNTYSRTLEGVIIVSYSVQFMFRQSNVEHEDNWGDNGLNWLNAGVLVYYSSGIFLFMLFNYLITAGKFVNSIVWGLVDTMLVLEYILYAIGFYKCKTHPKISLY